MIKTGKIIGNDLKCYFCNGNHICRECPVEASLAPKYKNKVGIKMENYIAEDFNCPECNNKSLYVLGNHSPSLDIICKCCGKKFEVKSKCLSVDVVPKDIFLKHGSYNKYITRLSEKLNLFVIIYGVNRIKKNIYIKEVLYANNSLLLNTNVINVKENNNYSTIFIKDKDKLRKLNFNRNKIISFNEEIQYNCY